MQCIRQKWKAFLVGMCCALYFVTAKLRKKCGCIVLFSKLLLLMRHFFCALPLNLCDNITPNRSLDRKSATGNGKDYLLSSFIFLLASCFSVSSRRSPLRLRTNVKQSAQQSNEICSVSNDRLGIKIPTDFAYGAKLSGYIKKEYQPRKESLFLSFVFTSRLPSALPQFLPLE